MLIRNVSEREKGEKNSKHDYVWGGLASAIFEI